MDCIFCKILSKEIPSNVVFENDKILAFYDIAPQAPIHVVIIPKIHISSANEVNEENSKYISEIFTAIPEIAKKLGIADSGYRIINNCGRDGCQSVEHIHFHMLGGRKMSEIF
ncbi:MAG TPA: histidine triad nucleotide-binding protein [Clostridiales bacterium]|nr:histidine triad nucleotide-binding protein [Clostridiales bacterium]